MDEQIRQMYIDSKQVHHVLYEDLSKLEDKFRQCNLADKVDIVYGLQQTSNMLDDLRKQIDKLERRLSLFACLELQHEQVDRIKTPHCSAKVTVKQFVKFPAKRRNDPDKFDTIMAGLGVPEDLYGSEAVRLNWEGFSDLITHNQANGKPLPEGIDLEDLYTEYTLSTRRTHEPDEILS